MSTSDARVSGFFPLVRKALLTFLAGVLTIHAFVVPFADANLVLCVGDDGHLAFELASQLYHHPAAERTVALRPTGLPPAADMACRDLGLEALNHLAPSGALKAHSAPVSVLPAKVDFVFPHVIARSCPHGQAMFVSFPAFLHSTVLLI